MKITLSHPKFRFRHVLKKHHMDENHPDWHYYNKYWKLQVAYTQDSLTEEYDWADVEDNYFIEDGEETIQINSKQFYDIIKNRKPKDN